MKKTDFKKKQFIDKIYMQQFSQFLYYMDHLFNDFIENKLIKPNEFDYGLPSSTFTPNLKMIENYRKTFYNSFFAYCYSDFEQKLIMLCKNEIHERNLQFLEGNRDVLKNIRKNMTNNMKLEFDNKCSNLWEEINDFKKIRNLIVHNGGYLPNAKNKQHIYQYINKRHDIALDNNKIVVEYEFCNFTINTFKNVFQNIRNLFILD